MKRRAVFIDRDGVLNECVDRGENFEVAGKKVRWTAPYRREEFKLKDGVEEALDALCGFVRILVTNQPDIAYGMLPVPEHVSIMGEIAVLPLDDVFFCFHKRNTGCACRKPKPGMLLAAAEKWKIRLIHSYMIGDMESDMKAGRAAGCRVVLIDAPYNQGVEAHFRARDLQHAAQWINQQA